MRSRRIDLQDLWFCTVTETQGDYLDPVKTYSTPIHKRFSVSSTSGSPYGWSSGWVLSYDRNITCYEKDFRPEEGTMVYVDVVPSLNKDGSLQLDDDGVPLTAPDYMIMSVKQSQRQVVARFAIKKV